LPLADANRVAALVVLGIRAWAGVKREPVVP
jgi:hypothetical protein